MSKPVATKPAKTKPTAPTVKKSAVAKPAKTKPTVNKPRKIYGSGSKSKSPSSSSSSSSIKSLNRLGRSSSPSSPSRLSLLPLTIVKNADYNNILWILELFDKYTKNYIGRGSLMKDRDNGNIYKVVKVIDFRENGEKIYINYAEDTKTLKYLINSLNGTDHSKRVSKTDENIKDAAIRLNEYANRTLSTEIYNDIETKISNTLIGYAAKYKDDKTNVNFLIRRYLSITKRDNVDKKFMEGYLR